MPRSLRKTFRFALWRALLVAGLLVVAGVVWVVRSRIPNQPPTVPEYRSAIQAEPLDWNTRVPQQVRSLQQDIEALEQSLKE